MKIIIQGNRDDFPRGNFKDPQFIEALKKSVRRRLELRPQDSVKIIFELEKSRA